MIYSPKKNIESFIEAKNEEIQTLKSKIMTERVTFDEMEQAKTILDSLKKDQVQLSKEGFE